MSEDEGDEREAELAKTEGDICSLNSSVVMSEVKCTSHTVSWPTQPTQS